MYWNNLQSLNRLSNVTLKVLKQLGNESDPGVSGYLIFPHVTPPLSEKGHSHWVLVRILSYWNCKSGLQVST